ncbi:hypothetical protein [Maricaulis sp. CAU 1757]
MYETLLDRLASGFTPFDWWLIIVLSLIMALIMRRWGQWPAAAGLAFVIDAMAPFFYRLATGLPANFAFDLTFARLDANGGVVVLLRLALYLLVIGALFWSKRTWGPR